MGWAVSMAGSIPCPQCCPICREKCYGRSGHSVIMTAPGQFATPHQCRRHVWMTIAEWCDVQRSIERDTRREVQETAQEAAKSRPRPARMFATGG